MSEDVFSLAEEMRRLIERRMREIAEAIQSEYISMERLFEERMKMLASGVIEPLVSIIDEGDHYVIVVEAPGVKSDLDIRFEPRRIIIEGYVDEKFVESAFGDMVWARSIRKVKGEYVLPEEIDIEGITVERKGSMIIIRAPKKR